MLAAHTDDVERSGWDIGDDLGELILRRRQLIQRILATIALLNHLLALLYELQIELGDVLGDVLLLAEIELRWYSVLLLRGQLSTTVDPCCVSMIDRRVQVIFLLNLVADLDCHTLFLEVRLVLLRCSAL